MMMLFSATPLLVEGSDIRYSIKPVDSPRPQIHDFEMYVYFGSVEYCCVWFALKMGHSSDGCLSSTILFKYKCRLGHLFCSELGKGMTSGSGECCFGMKNVAMVFGSSQKLCTSSQIVPDDTHKQTLTRTALQSFGLVTFMQTKKLNLFHNHIHSLHWVGS